MFYSSKLNFEEIKETKSDEYIKRYRKLMHLESEFCLEISDSVAETFTRLIRLEREYCNYNLVNAYFSGFKIGSRIIRDFDI